MTDIGFTNVDNLLMIKIADKAKDAHNILYNNPKGSEDAWSAIDRVVLKAKEIGELVHEAKSKCLLTKDVKGCIQDVENTEDVGVSSIGSDLIEYCTDGKIHHNFGENKLSDAEWQLKTILAQRPLFGEDAYSE